MFVTQTGIKVFVAQTGIKVFVVVQSIVDGFVGPLSKLITS